MCDTNQHKETHQTLWKRQGGEREGRLKEYNRVSELDQSVLYVSMKLSQWNPLVLLIYANKIVNKEVLVKIKF
jgi:hypothetical protein